MLLPSDPAQWPQDWRYRFDERAAILEFDAGFARKEAEFRAQAMTRAEAADERPQWLRDLKRRNVK